MPFPQRGSTFADERDGHAAGVFAGERHRDAGDGEGRDAEGGGGGQDPPSEIADVQVAAVHGRPRLPHLRAEHHAHRLRLRPHGEGGAEITDERRDHVATPAFRCRARAGKHGELNQVVAPTCEGAEPWSRTGASAKTGCSGSTAIQHTAPTRNSTPIKYSGRFQLLNHWTE